MESHCRCFTCSCRLRRQSARENSSTEGQTNTSFVRRDAELGAELRVELVERGDSPGLLVRDAALDGREIFVALVDGIEGVGEHVGRCVVEAEGELQLNSLVDVGRQLEGHVEVLVSASRTG